MVRSTVQCLTACSLLLLLLFGSVGIADQFDTLKVYTWPDYMDPDVVREFEKRHDVRVDFRYFASNEARDSEMAHSIGHGFDVILVNRLQIPKYVQRGWLQPLDPALIPNRRHIDQQWHDALGADSAYGVANFWGSLGIGYRHDLLPEGLDDWQSLLNPPDELRQRISMPASSRELMGIALKAQGLSANTSDEQRILDAGEALLEQKPFVSSYGYPLLDSTADLVTGKVWAGAFYNGDILRLQAHSPHIRFVIPAEGGILWIDYLTVASSSKNPTLAHALIDFLHEPEIAARQARFMNLASPNAAARALLTETRLSHPAIYPPTRELSSTEFLESLPPRSQKHINTIGMHLAD